MFTEEIKLLIIQKLDEAVANNNRAKAKARNPKFAILYDEEIALIREAQRLVRTWATQAPPTQEPDGKNKR